MMPVRRLPFWYWPIGVVIGTAYVALLVYAIHKWGH